MSSAVDPYEDVYAAWAAGDDQDEGEGAPSAAVAEGSPEEDDTAMAVEEDAYGALDPYVDVDEDDAAAVAAAPVSASEEVSGSPVAVDSMEVEEVQPEVEEEVVVWDDGQQEERPAQEGSDTADVVPPAPAAPEDDDSIDAFVEAFAQPAAATAAHGGVEAHAPTPKDVRPMVAKARIAKAPASVAKRPPLIVKEPSIAKRPPAVVAEAKRPFGPPMVAPIAKRPAGPPTAIAKRPAAPPAAIAKRPAISKVAPTDRTAPAQAKGSVAAVVSRQEASAASSHVVDISVGKDVYIKAGEFKGKKAQVVSLDGSEVTVIVNGADVAVVSMNQLSIEMPKMGQDDAASAAGQTAPKNGKAKGKGKMKDQRPVMHETAMEGGSSSSTSGAQKEPGYIFITSKATHAECRDRGLLASLEWDIEKMQRSIDANTKLLIYNQSTTKLMGIFAAVGEPGVRLAPGAFNNRFNAHLRVKPVENPIKEVKLPRRPYPGPKNEKDLADLLALLEMQGDPGEMWPVPDAEPPKSHGAIPKAKAGAKHGIAKAPPAGLKRPLEASAEQEWGKQNKRPRTTRQLPLKRQIEYLLSDKNLRYDAFLHGKISETVDNWIDASVILGLKKVQALGVEEADELLEALEGSESVEVRRAPEDSGTVQLRPNRPPPQLLPKPGWLANQLEQRKPGAGEAEAAPATKRTYQVGDQVRVRSGGYQGERGTVVNVQEDDISVLIGGADLAVVSAHELELTKPVRLGPSGNSAAPADAPAAADDATTDAEAAAASAPAAESTPQRKRPQPPAAPPTAAEELAAKREELRRIVMQREHLVPYLQPGRLLYVKDWGWGICVAKAAATKEGCFDVFLLVEPATRGNGKSPSPAADAQKADGDILAMPLQSIHRISKVRCNMPQTEGVAPDKVRSTLRATHSKLMNHPKFAAGMPELDPVEDMKLKNPVVPELMAAIRSLEERLAAEGSAG